MTHPLIRSAALLAGSSAIVPLEAQTAAPPVTLATSGYKLAYPVQDAAPGQLLVISLFGIKTRIPIPHLTTPTDTGWPSSVDGITVELVQGNPPVAAPVEVRGAQQAYCAKTDVCSTITGITLQTPFTLADGDGSVPYFRVSEGGQVVGGVLLRAVPDNVHVINTCDGTLIFLSAASSAPQDVCVPVAMSNQKLNSLYNLAHAGDAMSVWGYGMGALQSPGPAPLAADYTGAGTYQVNFLIPPVPSGLPACDGVTIKSNLTVTISGPNSFDGAPICVAP